MVAPLKPTEQKLHRVMLDANVLFAGTVWPRWSYEVLQHARQRDFALVLSPLVIQQAKDTLMRKYPVLLRSFEISLELCPTELVADPLETEVTANLNLVRQMADVPVALAAINAGVDYFVSEDKDFTEISASTQEVHRRLTIMRTVIFLREVMGWSSEALEKIRRRNWPID